MTLNQNICLLVNSLACGGAEKVVATLAPEFSGMGANMELISLEHENFHIPGDESIHYLSRSIGGQGRLTGKTLELLPLALRLKRYVAENNIALVQSHIYRANYINVLARLLGSSHKVQIVNHGMPSQYKKEGLKGAVNRFLVKWLYPKADQVICPSMGMIEELRDMGVTEEKLQLIHNPVDIDLIVALAREEIPPALFQFDPEKKYFIAIGRLSPVKRTSDIVEAFAKAASDDDRLELIILGDGQERESIESLVRRLHLSGWVHMPGFVTNPYQFLARSDVLVSASETEGFSIVIVDALALGVPVISTDCKSGPREIMAPESQAGSAIEEGKAEQTPYGYLVPVGDINSMAQAMSGLLTLQSDKERSNKDAIARAGQFNVAAIAKEYAIAMDTLMAT